MIAASQFERVFELGWPDSGQSGQSSYEAYDYSQDFPEFRASPTFSKCQLYGEIKKHLEYVRCATEFCPA